MSPTPGRRVPGAGDPRVDLLAGQLAALAGLGPLGDLDLQVVGVDQVLAGHAEAARGHLLDGAAAQVAVGVGGEAVGVLAALAGVGAPAEAVHGDGQGLVGLGRDGAVGHGAGGEAGHDGRDRLDLVDAGWGRPAAGLQAQQAAQGGQLLGLVVDGGGVLLEDGVLLGAGGVLELEDRLGVEEVVLALAAPLVLAAHLELAVGPLGRARPRRPWRWRVATSAASTERPMPPMRLAVPVKYSSIRARVEPDGLEDLGAGVGGHGRDAHLGHDLEHALAGRLDVVAPGLAGRDALEQPLGDHVVDGVERQVRVDRRRAEADEQRHVVHLAGVAGLDDQADLGPGLLAHQVVVHGRGQQQRRDGRPLARWRCGRRGR